MKRNLVLFLAAAAVGGLLAAGASALRRGSADGRTPPGKAGGSVRKPPPGKAAALAALAPARTELFLATDDLGQLVRELDSGPAGKVAAAPSVKGFLESLRKEPSGELGSVLGKLDLAVALAPLSDGPAVLAAWAPEPDAAPAAGFAARVKEGSEARALALAAGAVAVRGERVRDEPAGPGQVCRTVAPAGREGAAWGTAGRWIVACRSVAGCKSLLAWLARPAGSAPADAELARAIAAAGDGRLVGGLAARALLDPGEWSAAGLEPSAWLGYAARPGADGRWTERLVIAGRPTGGGLLAALAAGGERPVLGALPDSTLVCATVNVADGARSWAGLLGLAASVDPNGTVKAAAGALARPGGLDFSADVAPALRGELTAAWILPRGSFLPQAVLGAGLVSGAAAKLEPAVAPALRLLGRGGAIERGEHAGARLQWLADARSPNPLCPSPACALKGDLLLAGTSPVAVRDLLDARGGRLLAPAEAAELGAGLLGARASLARLTPFVWSAADSAGLGDTLAEGPSRRLPLHEEVGAPLGDLVLLVARRPGNDGVCLEVRGPLPLAAAWAAAALERNR